MTFTPDTYNYDGNTPSGVVGGASVPFAHGALSGLANDDHPQYLTQPEGDALYLTQAQGDVRYVLVGASQGNYVRTTADNTGVLDATAQLQADLATAAAAGYKRLYLPAGTYKISATAGNILAMATNGLEIFGDGIGKTILQFANGVTLTNNVYVFTLTGLNQSVHDLTIHNGTGMAGASEWAGVLMSGGCFYPHIYNVEVAGAYGGSGSNGFGIGTYQPWNQNEISTTLGTAIAAGTRTVTPGDMTGIYIGRLLTIGGTTENVIVTARTATTFTAVFAQAHNASDAVTAYSQGNQYALIENCYVHDCYQATGIGVNSCTNVVRRNRVVNIGSSGFYHSFYIQGGHNLFEGNYVAGVTGYCFHAHMQVPQLEGSGLRFIGNVSVNAGNASAHYVIDTHAENGTNPEIPNGVLATRYAIIQGNTLRNINGAQSGGIVANSVPITIVGNTLEDIFPTGGSGWIEDTAGSTIEGNILTTMGTPSGAVNQAMIRATGSAGFLNSASIIGNRITIAVAGTGISVSGTGHIVDGNTVVHSAASGQAISLAGTGIIFTNNRVEATSGGYALALSNLTALRMQGNYIKRASELGNIDLSTVAGTIADNVFDGIFRFTGAASSAVIFARNAGKVAQSALTSSVLDAAAQALTALATDGTAQTTARLIKISGGAVQIGTADTVFAGVTIQSVGAAANTLYYALQPGAVVPIDADAAWTAGNIGIASVTTGGKIHDSGLTTAPASGSYVLFLDSGGGAGVARCMLVKTL